MCLSKEWAASSSPSDLAWLASNLSFAWTFSLIQFRQILDVWTQIHNIGFRKTEFLSSPSKRLQCTHAGAEADDIDLFQPSRLQQCSHISAMRFIIHDANSTSKCGRDDAGIVSALGILLLHLFLLTSTTKLKMEKGGYSTSRKNLDCTHGYPSCSFFETSVCVNAYIIKIPISTYVIRLDCSNGFSNDALLFSLSANAVIMM